MNVLDIIILILFCLSIFNGIRDGLIRGAFLLIGAILGLLIATKYSSVIVPLFMNFFGIGATEAHVISYIAIFFAVGLLITLFHKLFIKGNHVLGFWDKLFGALFGLLESAILLSLIFILLSFFNFPSEELTSNSFFYDQIYNFAPTLYNFIKVIFPDTGFFFEELNKLI